MFALVKNQDVYNTDGDLISNHTISIFAPYTLWEDKNGTQYSPDHLISLTADQKQDMGIYDVAYASRPDDRFYSVVENSPEFDSVEKVVKITYTSTAKELEDGEEVGGRAPAGLKTQWINQIKDNVNKFLSQTDWMLVRKIERNINVPAATATYRAAVIAEATRLETAITAATTVEELITAIESASFPSAE
jgi:hypothetical protein